MIRYVLDTDTLTLYQEGHPSVCQKVAAHTSDELAITIISVEEQLAGWFTMLRCTTDHEKLARLYQRFTENTGFLSHLNIISFSLPAIERFEGLRAARLNIGSMDLRIAAIVLDAACVLVTRNVRDFQRVPGLIIEDWFA
jgi:tRNA(fMet)-specific endonuclease VapC